MTTLGAHPFSTGADQCLVHNGSLSNHNNLRRELQHDGMTFETENDTEVAAAYLTWRMNQGLNLGEALEKSLDDLDGFYTFVVGTKNGFGVLRDPDRLQAGRDGRDGPATSPSARNIARSSDLPGIDGREGLGAGARDRLFLGALMRHAPTRRTSARLDRPRCANSTRRCTARRPAPTRRRWEVLNPQGQPCGGRRRRRADHASRSRAASAIIAPA